MSKEKTNKPDWFIIENYNKAHKFNKEQWFEQLTLRFMLYHSPKDNSDGFLKNFDNLKTHTFPDYPEAIISFTELLQKPTTNNYCISIGDLLQNHDHKPLLFNNVWSTTTSEIVKNFTAITNNKIELKSIAEIGKLHQKNKYSMSPVNKIRIKSIDDLLNNDDDILGRRHLTIDLNGTETEIKKDFERWLKYSKNHFDKNEKRQGFSDTKIKIWANDRILAYLDLLIWCKLEDIEVGTNKALSEEKLIEWIDVRSDYDINNIKKEVNKLRDKLMNFNSIIRLYKYAFGSMSQQQINRVFARLIKKYQVDLSSLFKD